MAASTTNAVTTQPSADLNRPRVADITSSFTETTQPLIQGVEPNLDQYGRVAATIDIDTPSTTGKGGGALRSISDNFTVNPANGTLSLNFPIPTSAGRSGFGPSLSLAYDSGFGNGPFGIGWKLTGVESVTRRMSKAIPKFNDSDLYVLANTEDLIPSLLEDNITINEVERNGFFVRQYRPRVESRVNRIERWTRTDNHDEIHWRTISSANVVTIFGDSDESRLFEIGQDGKRNILSWLASFTCDPFGNAIELRYKSEDGIGVENEVWERSRPQSVRSRNRYLKSIRFGNSRPQRHPDTWQIQKLSGESWLFEIVLDYGEHDVKYPTLQECRPWPVRTDPFSTCKGGFELRTYRLCHRILTFHHLQDEPENRDFPASSTSFLYKHSPVGTFLTSMTVNNYERSSPMQLKSFSFPPNTFQYSEMPTVKSSRLEKADTSTIETLASGTSKWLDLDGEGAPGLLIEHKDAAWSYQRNESPLYASSSGPKLGKAQWIDSQPSLKNEQKHRFEDLDGNSVLDLVYEDPTSGLSGFSERQQKSWTDFVPFTSNATTTDIYGQSKQLDLTGNGLADILYICEESNTILWQESLKREGFGQIRRVQREVGGPSLVSPDPTGQVYLADMTGDGMSDIVRISASSVSYWPNLGYGKFGPEVIMGKSPKFDTHEQFNHSRIRLGDFDGSGTTDIIYLSRNGGIKVFYNMAGNSWSAPQKNPRFPVIDDLSLVFTLDLLGNGTSCLCWTGPDQSARSNSSLYYLDFTNGEKRYLLKEYSNGFGSFVSFSYRPSTWFFLDDERRGCPWTTKLPFPVHCVHEVTKKDCISQTKTQKTFSYHEGYYDGIEREFGGFGMVETWDSEDFSTTGTKPYQRPQIHKKLWFYTGSSIEASDESTSYQSHPPLLEPSSLPITGITPEEKREALRALRGMALREELYSIDNSSHAATPYLTVDTRYSTRILQERGVQPYSIIKVNPREVLSTYYERHLGEPRVQHDITLQVNDYGNVTKSVSITYGIPKSKLKETKDKDAQQTSIMTYRESDFTNPITEEPDNFRGPLLAGARTYAIRGFEERQLFDYRELTKSEFAYFRTKSDLEVERENGDIRSPRKVRIKEKRLFYRSSDLSGRLDAGAIETFSILDQQYDLAFTPGLLDAEYADIEQSTGHKLEHWVSQSGLVELEKGKGWWRPSLKCRFAQSSGRGELAKARASFYIPTITIDAFDNRTTTQMDKYSLFAISATDAEGYETHARYSYIHLRAIEKTDANGNREQIALDSFGRVVGVSRMGKIDENVGDSLEGFEADLTEIQTSSFLETPTTSLASMLLKSAGCRKIYDYGRWHRTSEGSSTGLPNFEAEIIRNHHHHDQGDSLKISIKISYLDGSGSSLQAVTLSAVEDSGNPTQWHYSEWHVVDSKGNPVRRFRPSYSTSHEFVPQSNVSSPATTLLYDPLDRLVGTLNANRTWNKTQKSPWITTIYDEGNTVLYSNLAEDQDVGGFVQSLELSTYSPSWFESRRDPASAGLWEVDGAEKSKQFHDKPLALHLDPLGRAVLAVIHDGSKELFMRQEFDVSGNRSVTYDKFGRKVDQKVFDLLGNAISTKSLDTGETWSFFDCNGQILASWNSRKICKSRVYDKLRRETELWVRAGTQKILATKTIYGKSDDMQAKDKNLRGRIAAIKDQAGIHRNVVYDFKGNCIQKQKQLTLAYNQDIDWNSDVELSSDEPFNIYTKFDALDRVVQTTNALGHITFRDYNPMGLLDSCSWRTSSNGSTTELIVNSVYNPDRNPTLIIYGNGTRAEFTYDDETRRLRRKRVVQPSTSTRPVIEDLSFSYDCQHRLTHVTDDAKEVIFFRNSAINASKDYSYDVQGRLVRAEGREQVNCGHGGGQSLLPYDERGAMVVQQAPTDGDQLCRYAELYTYDDENNLKSMQHMAIGSPQIKISGWTRTYLYAEDENKIPIDNRLLGIKIGSVESSFAYKGSEGSTGCITSMPGFSQITWDYLDKMRSSSKQRTKETLPETTWYVYDANGSRVRKVTENSSTGQMRKTKETLFIGDAEIYRTYESDGITMKTTKTTSGAVGSNRVALFESNSLSGGTDFLVRYQLSNSLELDDKGRLVSYEEYTPFGVSTYVACGQNITAPSKYRYNAYERDDETGLFFCRARYYSPWLGRWMSPDPLGTVDGPNIYCYVSNDPVNFVDPEGTYKDGSTADKAIDVESDTEAIESDTESDAQMSYRSDSDNSVDLPLLNGNKCPGDRDSEGDDESDHGTSGKSYGRKDSFRSQPRGVHSNSKKISKRDKQDRGEGVNRLKKAHANNSARNQNNHPNSDTTEMISQSDSGNSSYPDTLLLSSRSGSDHSSQQPSGSGSDHSSQQSDGSGSYHSSQQSVGSEMPLSWQGSQDERNEEGNSLHEEWNQIIRDENSEEYSQDDGTPQSSTQSYDDEDGNHYTGRELQDAELDNGTPEYDPDTPPDWY